MDCGKYLTLREIKKISDNQAKYKAKCECGVTAVMMEADRKICYRCGKWIYRNDQIKFRYEMMQRLREAKANGH